MSIISGTYIVVFFTAKDIVVVIGIDFTNDTTLF